MKIMRVIVVLSFLGVALTGCSAIRGASSGAPGTVGDAWYVRASTFSGKIKDVHYCPPVGSDCYKANFVSKKELAAMANNSTSGGEQ